MRRACSQETLFSPNKFEVMAKLYQEALAPLSQNETEVQYQLHADPGCDDAMIRVARNLLSQHTMHYQ